MRIREIVINTWRHFQNIRIEVGDNAGLVCIVGANGTGKSHILELIAACAHRVGFSQGAEASRGDPFNDLHEFSVEFHIAVGVSELLEQGLPDQPGHAEWDRTIRIESVRTEGRHQTTLHAGGITDPGQSAAIANYVVGKLNASEEVHFVSLDADRAYPKKNIDIHQIAQAYEIDWDGPEYMRGRSYKTTSTLYDEWLKYFLAQENQSGTKLIKEIRRARQGGTAIPEFDDHFDGYKTSLAKVLPHVVFAGIDSKKRKLLLDTTGLELDFDQLSGGEREIAFLVGQIDRFGLRNGLFLIDETELHLNSDLIRSWVAFLTGTVENGQVWLATHSLEAVEAAGQQATFILERNADTRKVDSLARLDSRPVLSALSRAVGTPAFSISLLRFLFVEGEESLGERERFRRLAGEPADVRFMECGSCNEVSRRVDAIKALARESATGIRIGGLVDRDFRSAAECTALATGGVHAIEVHEVENFYLHPASLNAILAQNGVAGRAEDIIVRAADERAGAWVFQYSMATKNAEGLPAIDANAKDLAKTLSWATINTDRASVLARIAAASGYDQANQTKLVRLLDVATNAYERRRTEADLWKHCEGKQVLNSVARGTGLSGAPALIAALHAMWDRDSATIPAELIAMRAFIASL